jgi:hypothetical protein
VPTSDAKVAVRGHLAQQIVCRYKIATTISRWWLIQQPHWAHHLIGQMREYIRIKSKTGNGAPRIE